MITGERDLDRDRGLTIRRLSRERDLDRPLSCMTIRAGDLDRECLRGPCSTTIWVGDRDRDRLRVVGACKTMVRELVLRGREDSGGPCMTTVRGLLLRERLDSPPSPIINILSDLPPWCLDERAPEAGTIMGLELRLRPRLRPLLGDPCS
jgi:hypothetical protein